MLVSHAPGKRHPGHGQLGGFDGSASDDDVRIELPGEIAQADGFSVEEERVDFPVVGEQFADLGLVVFHQAGVVARLDAGDAALDGLAVLVQPPEVIGRIVDAGGDALGAKGFEDFLGDVAMKGRVHDAEGGGLSCRTWRSRNGAWW